MTLSKPAIRPFFSTTSLRELAVESIFCSRLLRSTVISKRSTPAGLPLPVVPIAKLPIIKSPLVAPRPTSSTMIVLVISALLTAEPVNWFVYRDEVGGTPAKAKKLPVPRVAPVADSTICVPVTVWPFEAVTVKEPPKAAVTSPAVATLLANMT